MAKYEYVTIQSEKIMGAKYSRHRVVIDEYASKGYKYVGFVPTNISDYGKFKAIDLIFEKAE